VNAAFTEITGYTEEDSFGRNPSILKSGRHDDEFYANMWNQIADKGYWYGEIWNKRKNGELYPEWLRITAVYDENDVLTNYVATFSDISEIKQAEEQIHFYSNFDAATRLPNSKLFTELVEKELELARMDEHEGALLYVELIHLDKLTDNIGIGSVDSYINQLVQILYTKFGKDLVIGRISNTDLGILLEDITSQQVVSQSVDVAEFILETVKAGLLIIDQMAYIHANVGIVDYSSKDTFAEELIQHANTAANRARKLEPDSYQFYSSFMQKIASENYQTEVALREAIEKDEFDLLLQPQVDIDDLLIGAEALIRWKRGSEVVSPAKFIPIAEESNLIIDIGDWVLRRAMQYIKTIESEGMPESFTNISVNVSAIQIQQENFIAKLKQMLIENDITPTYLKLEITESAVLERPHLIINKISALKEVGVSVALDDFGTGYSSLAYLQKMQIDQLKIDRSFVTDLSINKTSQALTETIIVMARNLGVEVIAEGVENRRERSILASYGCTQYQGYYYSRPIDFEAFLDYARHPILVEE
jgi:PAS domain S-box-containing protein/diguanylate cyclase (GGDEF)-like protein